MQIILLCFVNLLFHSFSENGFFSFGTHKDNNIFGFIIFFIFLKVFLIFELYFLSFAKYLIIFIITLFKLKFENDEKK